MRCAHPIVEVEEFSDLGVHVRCLKCQSPLHLDEEYWENRYLPFTYTANSPRDKDDITLLIRSDVLNSWPKS